MRGSRYRDVYFMKIHTIKQPDSAACGLAVIKMITNYFDVDISMRKIKEITRYDKKEGMANRKIVKTLKNVGLMVREKNNTTWSDLQKANKKGKVSMFRKHWKRYENFLNNKRAELKNLSK